MQDEKNQNSGDNWDENPKYAEKDNAGGETGGGHYYYKQYTTPTGNPPPVNLPQPDSDGSTSKTLGIIGLIVTLCSCQIAGIVLGIIGLAKAKRSKQNLGFETPEAATGRVLGIVNIVLGILMIILSAVMTAFYIASGLFDEIFAAPTDPDRSVEAFIALRSFLA